MQTKTCTKCRIEKPLSEFQESERGKFGHRADCKLCCIARRQIYRLKHLTTLRQREREFNNKWRKEHPNYVKDYNKIYFKKYPYLKALYNAKNRCNNINNPKYNSYGGRGIKFLLSNANGKELWDRDKAYLMKRPSLDRISNDGNYCLENCHFIEWNDHNIKSGKEKRTSILQFDKQRGFIKEWESITEASKVLKISEGDISKCINKKGYAQTAGGFIWRYK